MLKGLGIEPKASTTHSYLSSLGRHRPAQRSAAATLGLAKPSLLLPGELRVQELFISLTCSLLCSEGPTRHTPPELGLPPMTLRVAGSGTPVPLLSHSCALEKGLWSPLPLGSTVL